MRCKGVDWIEVAQDRVQWRAFWTLQWAWECHRVEEFLYQLSADQEDTNSIMQLVNCEALCYGDYRPCFRI
jgi:hypothetical protein